MTVLSSEVADIIDTYNFGGVILFANNVKETEQTLRLTTDLQAAALANTAGETFGDIPLLLTIDQEGGIVYRLGSGTALPGNMAVGATRRADDARSVSEVIRRELNALKLNVNFAPVLDVNNNPNNPVIGQRSVSSDPALVSELGIPMLEGMQAHNVATAAKHFPGHGDAGSDSHTGLPRIEKTKEQLEQVELVPFKAAIAAGVDMVMTAHIQYPKVETETAVSAKDGETIEIPATLSKVFMTDILRTEMGFTGVAITDALNMQAIADHFGYIDAIKRAFAAGVDIALMPVTLRSTADVAKLDALIEAIEADAELTGERLDGSVRRILELKAARGILAYADEEGGFESSLAAAKEQVGSAENRAIERDVAADAVTVVRNEGGALPMRPVAGDHVLLVAGWENEQPGKLPVDVYAIRLVGGVSEIDTSAVVYPFGTGLTYPKVTDAAAVDKSALEAAVADADANVVARQDAYTAESYAAFAAALERARAVLGSDDATQDGVDAAVKALADAKAGLMGKGAGKPDPMEDVEPGRNGRKKSAGKRTPSRLPRTGDAAGMMAATAAAAAAGAVKTGEGLQE